MIASISAVRDDKMSIAQAAREHNVPKKTLDDRIKNKVVYGTHPGPSTVLTQVEEDALMSYLIYMGGSGFPLTRTFTKALAWAIAVRSGKHGCFGQEGPSEHWWTGFRRRHPDLTLRKADKLERSRAECLNPEVVKQYFKLLGDTLEKHKLKNSPRQIYNCDETFIPLDCSREKVIALKKSKNTYLQAQGTSEHITMLCAASAAGLPLPPMIIYSKSFPGGRYCFEGPDDALYAKSDSGWIDSELFLMQKIFLKHVVTQRPVLLFTNGHKSHLNLDVIDLCVGRMTSSYFVFRLIPFMLSNLSMLLSSNRSRITTRKLFGH